MHLGLRAPNIWFRARLRYPDARAPGGKVDVAGFTLAGLPAVVVGSNGHVAWGFTNSYGDWLDWRVAPPCPSTGAVRRRDHASANRITVAGGDSVDARWSRRPAGARSCQQPPIGQRARAALGRASAGLGATCDSLDLARAGSLEQALAVADRAGDPGAEHGHCGA